MNQFVFIHIKSSSSVLQNFLYQKMQAKFHLQSFEIYAIILSACRFQLYPLNLPLLIDLQQRRIKNVDKAFS